MNPQEKRIRLAVENAFLDLLRTRDFDKITKSSICRKAEVGTTTFYRHYGDKYNLVADIVSKIADRYVGIILSARQSRFRNILNTLKELISENLGSLKLLLSIKSQYVNGKELLLYKIHAAVKSQTMNYDSDGLFLSVLIHNSFVQLVENFENGFDEKEMRKILIDDFIKDVAYISNVSHEGFLRYIRENQLTPEKD